MTRLEGSPSTVLQRLHARARESYHRAIASPQPVRFNQALLIPMGGGVCRIWSSVPHVPDIERRRRVVRRREWEA
eukprot:11188221-Lingulodinium_polyedra.AAC.1